MKRLLSMMLALVMALGIAGLSFAEAAPQQDATLAVGDTLHGFVVDAIGTFDLLGVPSISLTHEKTGAQVYHIESADTNRAFDITFRTPALNNHGTPHVFEHATISGSDKYPSANLFFPMTNQTYNTFINAMTGPNYTTYPLASLSEDQLYKLADVYLDGVFHPMLYNEERLFRREAWRYELADKDAPLTITGTVYNEMKGASTISSASRLNMLDALYPDSILSNNSGGDPEEIPNLTHQELLDFHDAYYHPSNSLTTLYGDLDLPRFLELLDGYFSTFEKKEIEVETGDIPARDEYVQAVYPFAVEETAIVDNASIVTYSFVANGASREDEHGLNLLTSVLSHESSPLMQAVRREMPGASVAAYIDNTTPQVNVVFEAGNVNEADIERFKALIDETVAGIIENGLDKDAVDAIIATNKFSTLVMAEMPNLGPNLVASVAAMWAGEGDTEYFNAFLTALDRLAEMEDTSYYTNLLETYVQSNPHRALVATVPQAGLAEEKAQALADQLATYKASLSDEEIQTLVDQTAEMIAFSATEPPKDMLADLQAVTVDTLPEEIDMYAVKDRETDGVRIVTAEAQVGQIGYTELVLDTASIPVEDLHYLNLYTALLGMLDTDDHSKEALTTLNTRYLNGLGVTATMRETPGEVYVPALSVSWMGLMDEYETGLALTKEILFDTQFTDVETIAGFISILKSNARDMLSSAPYAIQMNRAQAIFRPEAAYANYLSGIDWYLGLSEMEALMATDPAQVTSRLEAIQEALRSKENAIATFVGNADSMAVFEASIDAFFGDLPGDAREAADLSTLPIPALREALVVDSTVQYNLVYAPLEAMDLEYSGIATPAMQVIYDVFLTPRLRHGIGAYGILTNMGRSGTTLCSYRDPSVADTYAVYEELPAFLAAFDLPQEEMDRYIISAYSSYAMPTGALNGGANAVALHLAGRSQEEQLERMQEVKALTVQDIVDLAPAFEKMLELGARSTAGSASAIEANSDLFDVVLKID